MKVILLKEVGGVGKRDAVVAVADGYALNFMIPRGLAVQATPDKLAVLKEKQQVAAMSAAATDAEAAAHIKQLKGVHVHVSAKANTNRHLYKHLPAEAITAAIKQEFGFAVPVSAVHLHEPIKTLGEWSVDIRLGSHSASCTVTVAAE
ncbi:50S ribosomal protein L9 [Candidatus Kaiserbacteria bacterium]|nr:50S ribosomal protein L9 [Candidatus Kaiserbacteria bacterium]